MKPKKTNNQTTTTPRQLQILQAISNFRDSRCCSPTMAELAEKLGTSRSTVFEHIAQLRKKGLLSTSPNKARSLRITSKAQNLLDRLSHNFSILNTADHNEPGIPLLGKVAAGMPIEAIESTEPVTINSHFAADENTFALEVQGDSMTDDGLYDGDYIICQKTPVANNGRMVVAIVDDDYATVKRFYKEKNAVRLQPANENYKPIYTKNCRIEAVVLGLVRKF